MLEEETPKHRSRKPSQFCKKLKGHHDYDIDESGIYYWGLAKKPGAIGALWVSGTNNLEDEDLPEGYVIESIDVNLLYKCSACGRHQLAHNKLKL